MSILAHPILLSFLIVAFALLILSLFLGEWGHLPTGIAVILVILYVTNALLMGFPYLEVVITLLVVAILFIVTLLIKERKR